MFQIILRSLLGFIVICLSNLQTAVGQDDPVPTTKQDATAIVTQYSPLTEKPGPHPDFILPSIDGDEMIQLSKYRGKKVLLLHFASW